MKKLLATILSMVLILSAVPALAVSAESGDADKLDTLEELVEAIKAAEENTVVTLEGDINMSEAKEYPIATLPNGVVINGNGYSLTNLTMQVDNSAAETAKDLSIFALEENAKVTIKNLTIGSEDNMVNFECTPSANPYLDDGTGEFYAVLVAEVLSGMILSVDNVDIYADMTTKVNGGSVVGGFVSVVEGSATFFYSSMNGSMTSEAEAKEYGRVGGFVGAATGISVISLNNCVNNADITGESNVGGFIGTSRSYDVTVRNCTNNGDIGHIASVQGIGGIIGKISVNDIGDGWRFDSVKPATEIDYVIENCTNNGEIKSTNSKAYTGGLIGEATYTSVSGGNIVIRNCVNNETVVSSANGGASYCYTGGIIGNVKDGFGFSIDSCVNLGEVSSQSSYTGGIVGQIYTRNGYSYSISNCVNLGNVSVCTDGSGYWPTPGGIVGYLNAGNNSGSLNISGCFNYCDIFGSRLGQIMGSTNKATKRSVSDSGYVLSLGTDMSKADKNCANGDTYDTLSELAAAINAVCKAGRFVAVEDEYIENQYTSLDFVPAPVVVGAQVSSVKTVEGKKVVDVRFVAVLKDADLTKYSKVGFKVDAVNTDGTEGGTDKFGDKVYTAILANTDAGARTYTTQELNGEYIIAIDILNVPAGEAENVELTATAYVTWDAAETGTNIFSANSTTIKLTAGEYGAE